MKWKSVIIKDEVRRQSSIDKIYSSPYLNTTDPLDEKNMLKLKTHSTLQPREKREKEDTEHYYSFYKQERKEATIAKEERVEEEKKTMGLEDPLFQKKYGNLNQYSGIDFIEKIHEGHYNIIINIKKLAQRMCPIFYFHDKEKYKPMDVGDYIQQCILRHEKNDIYENEKYRILKDYPVTVDDLKKNYKVIVDSMKNKVDHIMDMNSYVIQEKNGMLDKHFYITPKYEETYLGATVDEMTPYYNSKVPLYCHVVELDKEYRLLYSVFFPYYTGYKGFRRRSSYEGQWSYVSFYFHKESLTMSRAYYRGYNDRTSYWVAPIDIQYEKGRPIVYISKGTHYCYPYPKNYRHYSIFSPFRRKKDYCRKGIRWFPNVKLMVINNNQKEEEVELTKTISPTIQQEDVISHNNQVIEKNMKIRFRGDGGERKVEVVENTPNSENTPKVSVGEEKAGEADIQTSEAITMEDMVDYTEWLYFKGRFGRGGGYSPYYEPWFNIDDPRKGVYLSDLSSYPS